MLQLGEISIVKLVPRLHAAKKGYAERINLAGFRFDKESLGKRVVVDGYDSIGTIAFVGPHHVDKNPRVGIILDTKVGRNNGTVKGNKYFECESGFGVLVVPYKVHLVDDVDSAD